MKLALCVLLGCLLVPLTQASTVITFDGTGAGCTFAGAAPLREEYAGLGVHFAGGSALNGGAILNECGNFGIGALSGTDFLALNGAALLNNGGVPSYPQYINFDLLQSAVSIYLSGRYSTDVFRLHAFDGLNGTGTLLDSYFAGAPGGQWSKFAVAAAGIRSVAILPEDDERVCVADNLEFSDALNGEIPEPATWTLLSSALGVAFVLRGRKRG